MFTRKSIIQKTVQVGGSTLISRFLGIIREILMIRYMGASALSDAFITAWKVPNSLRKIFAEGALSAAFVPTIVQTVRKEGRKAVNGLMSLGFLVFEGVVLILCAVAMANTQFFIFFIAPGFSQEQIIASSTFLYILMPFIFLISTSALLAGPLQAIGHFAVSAFGPVFLNIIYILGLIVCLVFELPITTLCWFIMLGGVVQLLAHIAVYINYDFGVGKFNKADLKKFGWVLLRFIPCLVSMSVMEIGLFIDTSFASLLSKGSVSLIYYANRFMGIPLGVFAVALSTILLPHFSRISSYAPQRLGFYVLEATKLVWWVTIPVMLAMMLFSQKLFMTLFLSDKFSIMQAHEAGNILIASLIGLFFFAINKILSNVYYALHHTVIPALIAVGSVGTNILLNWLLIDHLQAVGLALATTAAAILQTIFLYGILSHYLKLNVYPQQLGRFFVHYTIQLAFIGVGFVALYQGIYYLMHSFMPVCLTESMCLWFWVLPLCMLFMLTIYATRSLFGIRILFLEGE